jgi:hypothetical protein
MSDYLYSPDVLKAEVRKSEKQAAARAPKRVNEAAGDLEVTRSIPRKLYMNAVVGHGVDPNDTGYWKDMERYVPSIKIRSVTDKIIFGPMARYQGKLARITRFGKASYSKSYG